ncbi:MAG: alkaline shock response membrane anchor protein AmaP [Peptostreptococcus porci]|uniref:Alkaline shock response membrane anchor protein AmaP n=1 Tax=Peptostreptococcus porci TaxID=2652282 RepID=A0A6N7XGZ4_9FIRM|nr:alkaline shock response membrane anchor protein AmaP [Peptostreptococcus porci]MDY5480084.1 alkaline shock response membrane anchor protein AmaP [Peptostreptococcus porci]MST62479.1 alkaline shock response membrane anchor protein AmaP [Peptostreptococcus porci]
MTRFKRAIDIICYLIIILTILLLNVVSFDTVYGVIYESFPTLSEYLYGIVTVLSVISLIFIIVKMMSSIKKKQLAKFIQLNDGDTSLEVSVDAVKNVVQGAVGSHDEVFQVDSTIELKTKDGKQNIYVTVNCGIDKNLLVDVNLGEFCSVLQDDVNNELESFLGIAVDEVNIKVFEVENKAENGIDNKGRSRTIN